MVEWRECTLAELTLHIASGATPRGGSNSYKNEGVSLIRSQNILDLELSLNGLAFIDDQQAAALNNVIVNPNDVLLNITGDSVARVCKVLNSILPARVNQHVAIIRVDEKKLHSDFLLYNLIYQKESLLSQAEVGATRKAITKGIIQRLKVNLPPLPEQKAIAEVLSSLDDKIDLLHRQNKTLESLAETLFRQWFIEEAKDEWVETKLGFYLIPKKGENLTKSQAMGGDIPVVAGGLKPSCFHNRANTDKPVITISASGANAGFIKLYYESVWSSDSSYIDSSVTKNIYFIYNFLKVNQIALFKKQTGSAQPHIYPQQIMDLDIRKYPQTLIDSFEHKVIGFFAKISNNNLKLNKLTHLRDILLPNLMSGKVRISI